MDMGKEIKKWKTAVAESGRSAAGDGVRPGWFLGLGLILFFAFVTFLYADLTDTYENSILFLKAIREGKLFQFYSYSVEHTRSFWGANYDALIYVFYGLWNLPVLIVTHLLGIDYFDWAPGLLWCKLLGVLLCGGIAWQIRRILLLTGVPARAASLGSFLYLSSLSVFTIVFVIAQVDSIALFLLTRALYFYLAGRDRLFYLCVAVAMPCKMFAVFLFLPLLLLREKRVVFIVGKTLLVFSLSILSGLIFGRDPAYGFALGSQSRDAAVQILESRFFWGQEVVLFLLFYMGLCVFCYVYDGCRRNRLEYRTPIYCVMAAWIGFVCFVNFNSYWVYYLTPFLILGIVSSGRFLKLLCYLEMIFSVGYVGVVVFYCSPLADLELVSRLFLGKIIELPEYALTRYGSVNYMVETLGLDVYAPVFSTCMIGALFAILILTCPLLYRGGKEKGILAGCLYGAEPFAMPEPTVFLARLALPALFAAFILYAYLTVAPQTAFSNLETPNMPSTDGLLQTESCLSQEVELDESRVVTELQLMFRNPDDIRNNFSSVRIELADQETGAVLFEERVGCSMIETAKRQTFSLGGIRLEAGRAYEIRLTGIKGTLDDQSKNREIFPYVTRELEDAAHPAVLDGAAQDYNLLFRLR